MSKNYMSWFEAEKVGPIFSMENLPIMHRQYQFKHLEGELLTLIEELGLKETQERAAKNHIRDVLWNNVRLGCIIPSEIDDSLGDVPHSPKLEKIA